MTDEESNESDIVTVMHQTTQVDHLIAANPTMQRYGEMMSQRKITGHKCPECSFVYVPPKNYCPMCVIPTGLEHEVVVEAKGTETSFTVIDPSQYPGAEETEAYVVASILLDGASLALGQAYGGAAQYFAMWIVSDVMP